MTSRIGTQAMFKTIMGAATLLLAWPAAADGQILRIGPLGGVSVRAPFVSVDVGPFGGTRVRAPLTAIDTPDRYYMAPGGYGYAPIPPGQAVPYRDFHSPYFRGYHRDYSQDVHPGNGPRQGELRGEILAVPFDGPYDPRFDGGPIPHSSFRLELPEIERPPAPQFEIPSFSEVFPGQEPLVDPRDWNSPPPGGTDPTRLAERLLDNTRRLQQALARRQQGEVWAEYLRCAELEHLASELIASRSLAPVTLAEARELLGNFDGVVANTSLTWVTRLTGFDDTRGALANLVMVLEAEASEGFSSPEITSPAVNSPEITGDVPQTVPRLTAPRLRSEDAREPRPGVEELPAPVPDPLPEDRPPENGPPVARPLEARPPAVQAPAEPRPVFRAEL